MQYQFSSEVNERIDAQLALGVFKTPDEVVINALDALDQQNADLASIKRGLEDEQAGRLRPLREVDREFRLRNGVSPQE